MSNYNPQGGGLQYRGTAAVAPPNCNFEQRDPTPYDRSNFSLNDFWLNIRTDDLFVLVSLEGTSTSRGTLANWVKLSTGQVGVFSLTGNDAVTVTPNGSGNIFLMGSDPITVTGNPGTFTETISVAVATSVQIGVTTLSNNAQTIAGIDNTHVVTPQNLTAKLGTQTANAVAYGQGTATAVGWTNAGTNGQLIIAATGAAPAFASLTSTGGSITITPGPNTLNIDVEDQSEYTVTTTDGTPTTLVSIAVTTNQAITLEAEVIGATSTYSAAIGGNCLATARRAGGSLTLVGSPVINLNEDSGGSPDFNVVVSGNNLIVQVTGEAATTYNWKATVRIVTV